MPKVDLTITISVVIAICAIISPVITTILNNHHQLKLKKLELKAENEKTTYFYKRGIYENYLKYSGRCITLATRENLSEYGETYMLALIYFPENLQPELIKINESINVHNWDEARAQLNTLAPKIRSILKNM